MMIMESCLITAALIYSVLAFRTEKPPMPPSAAALVEKKDISDGMMKDMWTLIRNPNYMLILVQFMLIYCIYAGLGFIIDPLFEGFGFTSVQVSAFGAAFVLFGTISTVIVGKYLDRTKRYLFVLRAIPICGTIVFIGTILVVPHASFWPTLIFTILGGMTCVPIIAVSY